MTSATAGSRRRVLFVINSLAGGGAERVMTSLIAASEDRRDRFDMALALIDQEPRHYPVPDWLEVHQLDGRMSLPRSIGQVERLARRWKPDLSLSFLTRANIATTIASLLHRHPGIISERANTTGHFKPGPSGRVAKGLIRATYPRAARVVAPSAGIAEDLADAFGVAERRIVTIANPVDAARIRALAREPATPPVAGRYAVAVARLAPSKNVGLLVDALAASGSDLSLVILGQGPERARIEARVAGHGLSDRVVMPGFVANPYPIVAGAACYLSASNGEGFPNGLVEALALGVPAAMANCASGPSEILADMRRQDVPGLHEGRYGILVPPNDVDAMARAIAMVSEPARAETLAAAGPSRADEYSVKAATDRYWQVIEAALDRRH
ncbi:glycosyltransferase [Sphingomonas sp.]|uniref:glycosyltransferase n=1 Tax=Sphingomonas sp. TaxID=28214 RepID=UPI003AFFE870